MKGWKRKIAVNKEEVKRLKKKLKDTKNTVEVKRLMIMIVYLWGQNTKQVSDTLKVSNQTVINTINKYIKNKEDFYKTSFTGRKISKKSENIRKKLELIVEEKLNKWEIIDIKDVADIYNRKEEDKLEYYKVWWYLRKVIWYNYQKPYVKDKRQSEHAEEILRWRLTKAIIEIWKEEREIDAYAIKNKKNFFGAN